MRSVRPVARFALIFLIVGAVLGGCEKKITIYQYPQIYRPNEIRKIGIFPFRCPAAPRSKGGTLVADAFHAALAGSGTYQHVYNRNDLAALAEAHDMKDLFSNKPSDAAMALRKFTDVDAIIIGSVTAYAHTSHTERRNQSVPMVVGNTVTYYRQAYDFTRNEARVGAVASLIRTSDGKVLYTTPSPCTGTAWAQGNPPKWDRYACLSLSTGKAVETLMTHFGMVRKTIKLKTDKALRTASELYDNKWTWKDAFKATEEDMYVVVGLPWEADRNKFKIVIVRKGTRKPLATRDLTWTKKHSAYGYLFDPRLIARTGGGPGTYTIKFYSGPEPILTRDFRIVN